MTWQRWDFRCDRFPARPKFSSFMTTLSVATYKPIEQQRDSHAEGGAAEGRVTTNTALPEISQLTEVVCVMMEERERRQREIAEDRKRRDPVRGGERTPGPGACPGTGVTHTGAPANGPAAGRRPPTVRGGERTPPPRRSSSDGTPAEFGRWTQHYDYPRPCDEHGIHQVDKTG